MLKLLSKVSGQPGSEGRKKLVLAACGCARLTLPHVPKDETRPLTAIEIAEKWARGEDVDLKQVEAAAADADTHARAIINETHLLGTAYVAILSAASAARAAYAPHPFDEVVGIAVTSNDYLLREYAGIVRRHFPEPPPGVSK
jgi:hypothetical protein